ncbi:MAG: SDR family NAD(P)-dependent oxidoreductase [Ectothiorhodospiraceae bacterium]|jgi:NAD(P)-dependent dehydrogenase (short-subunit alcohol dehydrogenase family)
MKSDNGKRLAQRRALVTGAGTPVGRAICESFAREGAWVIAVDGDIEAAEASAALARAAGGTALALKTEALDPTITEHIVDTAVQRVWQVDILVNNTSRLGDGRDGNHTDWAATMAVNLEASYRFALSVLPRMRSRGTGVIVTAAWCWGDGGETAERLAREASVAAVQRLTRGLAAQAADSGIACYALAPRPGAPDPAASLAAASNGSTMPVGSDASPEQVAEWVARLAATQGEVTSGARTATLC